MTEAEKPDLTSLTVQLLSAYVSNNTLPSNELADLIRTTRGALEGEPVKEPSEPEFVPAVSVRKSLASRDHIISMIDGKPYKSLKRHLSSNGLTPNDYRARYNLASDYPMVAPGYSEQRREVAQRLGLGRKRADAPAQLPEEPSVDAQALLDATPGSSAAASPAGADAPSTTPAKTAKRGAPKAATAGASRKAQKTAPRTKRGGASVAASGDGVSEQSAEAAAGTPGEIAPAAPAANPVAKVSRKAKGSGKEAGATLAPADNPAPTSKRTSAKATAPSVPVKAKKPTAPKRATRTRTVAPASSPGADEAPVPQPAE